MANDDTFDNIATERCPLTLGFVPLVDCAPLVIAKRLGYFADEGLQVELSRQASWAALRDKIAYGLLDGAHMLAAMPLAMSLGLTGRKTPMLVPLSLNINGNGIAVSQALGEQLLALAPNATALGRARALRGLALERKRQGNPLTFAMVFAYSSHNFQLRYWLSAGGIDPDEDVRIVVVPPPQMIAHLSAGRIDGFCVGAPWSELADAMRVGVRIERGYDIWNNAPEKVFAVTEAWAARHPRTLQALLRALIRAQLWLDRSDHRDEAARMLAGADILNAPVDVIAGALHRRVDDGEEMRFFRGAAAYPWRSHALWFLSQMRRWKQIADPLDCEAIAAAVYRPDMFRAAADGLGLAAPQVDRKREGEHRGPWSMAGEGTDLRLGADLFCDGRIFDPTHLDAYADQAGTANHIGPQTEVTENQGEIAGRRHV